MPLQFPLPLLPSLGDAPQAPFLREFFVNCRDVYFSWCKIAEALPIQLEMPDDHQSADLLDHWDAMASQPPNTRTPAELKLLLMRAYDIHAWLLWAMFWMVDQLSEHVHLQAQ